MVRPQVKVSEEYSTSWALGWGIQHSGKRNFIMHGGDNKGFHSFAVGSVDGKSGYVMMTNGENGAQVLKNVMAGLLNPFMERSYSSICRTAGVPRRRQDGRLHQSVVTLPNRPGLKKHGHSPQADSQT